MNREPLGYSWAMRDLLIALVVVFLGMAVMALAVHQNQKAGIRPGTLIIQMHWADWSNSDIDLWVKSPGDVPVGYSRLRGLYCDLLRDDLGHAHDPVSTNTETVVCRKAPQGSYIVNAMAYDVYDYKFPIPVTVTVTELRGSPHLIVRRTVELTHQGQELTVIGFSVDRHGNLIPDSLNTIQTELRTQQ